ncbi:hypothetical protein C825_003488 [Parabacteroides sp. ASF519]|uniref:Y4mF family transcriptional regulator n=3 Tax=Parabacteroides TaxID=375288 RepID=S0GTQ4_9BACT|nr:y4mF family transcriptional regulator [Parabacteroides goldsteinii dnLKV18]KAI4361424.1 hypothetical protein C825_003488 [Parabacteroides sp. ASF519]
MRFLGIDLGYLMTSRIKQEIFIIFVPEEVSKMNNLSLNEYVKSKRKSLGLSREEFALKAGVGLRFLRELEQGKETLKMDKVNQVLKLFGMQLGAVPMDRNNLIEP